METLPARRWVDWSSCVLRTALSLCFLWESRYYRNLGYSILTNNPDPDFVLGLNDPLLNWMDESTPLSSRNEHKKIKAYVADGLNIRRWLEAIKDDYPSIQNSDDLAGIIHDLAENLTKEHRDSLEICFNGGINTKNGTYETIVYNLSNRNEWGESADLYGLLKKVKRIYRIVEPSPEWLTVIASLSTNPKTKMTTFSNLKSKLSSLGVGFSKNALIKELERLGLSRVMNDADEAIEIKAAFSENS